MNGFQCSLGALEQTAVILAGMAIVAVTQLGLRTSSMTAAFMNTVE
jgi:hypothetical protein